MKMNVRQGVFETNSSSTHAIVFRKGPKIDGPDRWTVEEGLNQLRHMGVSVTEDLVWDGKTKATKQVYDLDFSTMDEELAEFGRTEEAYNEWGVKLLYAIVSFKNDEGLWEDLFKYLRTLGIRKIALKSVYDEWSERWKIMGDIDHDSTTVLADMLGQGMSLDDYLSRKDIYCLIDNEG